jgi:hypothetical protein
MNSNNDQTVYESESDSENCDIELEIADKPPIKTPKKRIIKNKIVEDVAPKEVVQPIKRKMNDKQMAAFEKARTTRAANIEMRKQNTQNGKDAQDEIKRLKEQLEEAKILKTTSKKNSLTSKIDKITKTVPKPRVKRAPKIIVQSDSDSEEEKVSVKRSKKKRSYSDDDEDNRRQPYNIIINNDTNTKHNNNVLSEKEKRAQALARFV